MSDTIETLPFGTLVHMIQTVKLNVNNYLLWDTNTSSVLECQDIYKYVDGSTPAPDQTLFGGNPNPAFLTWKAQDRRVKTLLMASLTEEAMAHVVGCNTAQEMWSAIRKVYRNDDKSHELRLLDEIQSVKRGSRSVAEYGARFKKCCDLLAAMDHSVSETNKAMWFLRGLGSEYSIFAATQFSLKPLPTFSELLPRAESYAIFQGSIEGSSTSTQSQVAFNANRRNSGDSYKGKNNNNRNSGPGNGGRNNNDKRRPFCQLCKEEGHYCDRCPKRFDRNFFYRKKNSQSANLAEAFSAGCNIHPDESDWYLDSGASAHMTNSSASLDSAEPYNGSDNVTVESSHQGGRGSRKT